jgi:DNA-binding transcriptional LysR family regulator
VRRAAQSLCRSIPDSALVATLISSACERRLLAQPALMIQGRGMIESPTPPPPAKTSGVPVPRLYVYFDAIVRSGSIRGAADSLRIAASALNRRVLDLEREAGIVLFERSPGGVRLTPAGEIFAGHVRRVLRDIREVATRIDEISGDANGHVAIGSAESAAIDVLPGFMAAFQEQAPGTRFTVAVGPPRTLLTDLLEDRVDLILTHEEPTQADVAVIAAAPMPFCAMMRTGHELADRRRLRIADAKPFPVVLAAENLAARALVEATLSALSLQLQPVLVTNMFEVMKTYVRQTDAVSFQFHLAPFSRRAPDGLVAVPLTDPQLAQARLVLAARRGRRLSAAAGAVRDRLAALLR